MEQQQLNETKIAEPAKTNKTRPKIVLCMLIVGILVLCAITGGVCWNVSGNMAKHQAEADRVAYEEAANQQMDAIRVEHMENFNYARTNAYRWVTDAWNRTLVDLYADVVFYGDSLTAGGAWGEWFPYYTCINLGVVGDTVDGLTSRIQQVEMLEPTKCFLLIGINDLNYGTPVHMTLGYYETLLQKLAQLEESMGVTIYVISVLPVREGEMAYATTNAQVRELNVGISAMADRYGMTYIDLHSHFADENGMLRIEYSFDGLHINEQGYALWQELIAPYVDE